MFCWMSLLSFDLFRTFNDLKIPKEKSLLSGRLICYSAIGIGVPVLMTLTIFIIDILELFPQLPGVGMEGCFLTLNGKQNNKGLIHKLGNAILTRI